ncbi:MAG TPA: lysoplasmalogenase [Streptosporangiaceae bacterium]
MRRADVAFAGVAAADAVLAVAGLDRARWLTKPALMPLLMPGRDRATRVALGFGWVGDVALLGEGEVAFQVGLAGFLAGHLAWIAALRRRPGGGRLRDRPALAVPPVAAAAVLNAVLWRRTGQNRVPVLAYSGALLAMSLTALDRGSPAAAAGGLLFLVSDAVLALEKFGVTRIPAAEGLVMVSYATAQALLAGAPA